MQNMASRIEEVWKDSGLTLEAFGKPLGVTKSTVHQWINEAIKDLKNETLFKFEDVYGVSARWLVTGDLPKYARNVCEESSEYSPQKKRLIDGIVKLDDSELTPVQSAYENAQQLHDARQRLAEIEKKAG